MIDIEPWVTRSIQLKTACPETECPEYGCHCLEKEIQSLREQVEELKEKIQIIDWANNLKEEENQQLKDQLSKYREALEAAASELDRGIYIEQSGDYFRNMVDELKDEDNG